MYTNQNSLVQYTLFRCYEIITLAIIQLVTFWGIKTVACKDSKNTISAVKVNDVGAWYGAISLQIVLGHYISWKEKWLKWCNQNILEENSIPVVKKLNLRRRYISRQWPQPYSQITQGSQTNLLFHWKVMEGFKTVSP